MLEKFKYDLIELGILDTVGLSILLVDLDASLKVAEILAGLSLFAYNVVKIARIKKDKDKE